MKKDVDPAFQNGVGHQIGLEIWKIEDSRPMPSQSSQYGKFCSDRAYIVLQTCSLLAGSLHHNIHYWLGRCTNQNDAANAAIKALELNASLGGHAIQEREMEGYESDKFLSYFKPCVIPLPKDTNNCNGIVKDSPYRTRLFMCRGRHVAHVKEVPFTRSSLSHDDVFILDTEHKIFQFSGANTNVYERAKALDVVQYLRDNFHQEKCHVAIIEDGKFVADVDSGEFWGLFGGFAPLMKRMENGHQEVKSMGSTLYTIIEGQLQASPLKREALTTNKSYILDSDKCVFTWMGRNTSLEDQKAAVMVAEELSRQKRNPCETKVLCINEDFEPVEFRSKFALWPVSKRMCFSESGREKVAVLLKQKGFNVKGLLKPVPVKEKLQLISSVGKLQVWCIKDGSKECLPPGEIVKFHGRNCYVVLHSYTMDQKEEDFVYTWMSNQSTTETRATAADQAKDIASSFQRKAVEARIFQGKEPDQFLSLFEKLILIKDGDPEGKGRLFQVYQSGASKWRALQVNQVAASLNSSSCFFLQTGDSVFTWYGRFTTVEEQEATKSMATNMKPAAKLTALKEGAETQSFWSMIGGRQTYQSQHEPTESARNPRLFSCALLKDDVKATEVFNFTHENFLSDEIMIVDCYTSVFVWVGETTSTQNKLRALEFGQKYLEQMAKYEGHSLETPTYKINEGCEPLLFTSLLEWDSTKTKHYLNPFERKVRAVKGESTKPAEVIINTRKISPASNGKGFQLIADKTKNSQKVAFKPEHPMNKFRQPKSKAGYGPAPVKTGQHTASSKTGHAPAPSKPVAVSTLSTMFELQNGRGAPPNTPIVKLSPLSLKPKGTMKESPPPTPCSRTTPRPSVSPAIASLTSVYESYNDRFAFAWPGMKLRHEERALSREVDTFGYGYETVEATMIEDEFLHEMPANAALEAPVDADVDVDVDMDAPAPVEQAVFPYERLKVSSANPVLRIDGSKRESYLSDEEFQETFSMDKDTFYKLPRWKQDKYKVLFDLF